MGNLLFWVFRVHAFRGVHLHLTLPFPGSHADPTRHLCQLTDSSINGLRNPRQSKTDPFGRGMTIRLGWTSHTICPVAAILGYLKQRGLTHGPLFIFRDGSTLSRQKLVTVICSALHSQGVDQLVLSSINGHSFRIGAATAATHAGMQDSTIQKLGRWRSSSFLRYIRTPGRQLAAVSTRLLDPIHVGHILYICTVVYLH